MSDDGTPADRGAGEPDRLELTPLPWNVDRFAPVRPAGVITDLRTRTSRPSGRPEPLVLEDEPAGVVADRIEDAVALGRRRLTAMDDDAPAWAPPLPVDRVATDVEDAPAAWAPPASGPVEPPSPLAQDPSEWAPPVAAVASWPPPAAEPVEHVEVVAPPDKESNRADTPPFGVAAAGVAAAGASTGLATLTAEHVACWFGSRKVLQDVNLTMPGGRVTALIGPSGCGKSTFLRSLNRMHELIPGASLAGAIRLNGIDIYGPGVPPTTTRLKVGMVFQRPNPFPAMTIAGNVLAGLRLCGRKVRHADEIVEKSLRRAGLWNETKDRLNSWGGALSGGQQQRLCIARSLAVQPDVLLMDEPCSALDPISTAVIEDTIEAIKDEVTIVIVTHNMQQASRVSDLCALFLVDEENSPGRIIEAGPTEQMFSSPRDPRTADYIAGRFG